MQLFRSILILLLLGFAGHTATQAQSFAFGIKGGPLVGFQQWNSFDQDPLFKYQGSLFIESYDDQANEFALFAQAGYHIKGSALRNQRFTNPINNNIFQLNTREFQFRNISVVLGGKKKYDLKPKTKAYYLIGIRGDYTVSTNLNEYETSSNFLGFFPTNEWVQPWNYGATVGGGFEFIWGELIGGIFEITVNPDFSRQYWQPPLENVYNPYTGTNQSINERKITNVTLEISLGLRFLRVVEYVD